MPMRALPLLLLALLIGCSGRQLVGANPPDAAAGVDDLAAVDGPAAGAMILVKTCCGGPAPICEPVPDSGVCEYGWCAQHLGAGCNPPPCTPPPSYYVNLPPSCGSHPSCSCFSQDPCADLAHGGFGTCGTVSNGVVQCLCA